MAEGLFAMMTADEEGQWQINSAGIATGGGQPPSEHTLSILNAENINLSGNRSQAINADLLNSASHIFAMSASHLYTLERRLKRFERDYGEWLSCDVSTEVVDGFLEELSLAPRTTHSSAGFLTMRTCNPLRAKCAALCTARLRVSTPLPP